MPHELKRAYIFPKPTCCLLSSSVFMEAGLWIFAVGML